MEGEKRGELKRNEEERKDEISKGDKGKVEGKKTEDIKKVKRIGRGEKRGKEEWGWLEG